MMGIDQEGVYLISVGEWFSKITIIHISNSEIEQDEDLQWFFFISPRISYYPRRKKSPS